MACFLSLQHRSTYRIPQDNLGLKVLCATPFIGTFAQLFVESSLFNRARNSHDREELIDIIELKNHYKIGGILRDCLAIALLVAGVAAQIILVETIITFSVISIGLAAYEIYKIGKNKEAQRTLDETTNAFFVSVRIH